MVDGYVVNSHGDRCCPLRAGLWDPFQMAVLWLINGGVILTTSDTWDDPPSGGWLGKPQRKCEIC